MNVSVLTKPRDVQVMAIAAHTLAFRSRSWTRLRFEIEYGLQRGTTANSYLIRREKNVLLDPPGENFAEIFLKALQQRFDLTQLNFLVLSHFNPNRAVTLQALLDISDTFTIVCSNPAALAIQSAFPNRDLKIAVVKGEEGLYLGADQLLRLIATPTPQWPDLLCTYDTLTQVLFTDKLFGAHVCGDQVFDEGWQVYLEDRQYYFECLMAGQLRQVETALEKLAEFPVSFYAPGHGPMVRDGLSDLTAAYRSWGQQQQAQNLSVALIYASAYGNTTTIGQALAHGITQSGVTVEVLNCEVSTPAEIQAAVERCDGVLIGSPTLGGHLPTQVQTALGIVLSTANRSQPVGVFGSFGWSGEGVDLLESKLREAGFSFGFEAIRVKFKPTDETLQECEQTGSQFAQTLKRNKKLRQAQPNRLAATDPSSRTEQAVGRVVGSLCVVTAHRLELNAATLLSWVSQASFSPPGFTMAISKADPIEPLLHVGDPCVLNILQEGKQLRRHFQKEFTPGEDRLAGLPTQTATNGGTILTESLAYLECRVASRLDSGDHWILYAVVDEGKVLQPNGRTAVLHRKSATQR